MRFSECLRWGTVRFAPIRMIAHYPRLVIGKYVCECVCQCKLPPPPHPHHGTLAWHGQPPGPPCTQHFPIRFPRGNITTQQLLVLGHPVLILSSPIAILSTKKCYFNDCKILQETLKMTCSRYCATIDKQLQVVVQRKQSSLFDTSFVCNDSSTL